MTHLRYIIAAYAVFAVIAGWFAVGAWTRAVRTRRRLAAIDPRHAR